MWSINQDKHTPPKSPYWYACFRDEHSNRVRKSTKTTDRALAEEIAMKWAQLAKAGRDGRLTESRCRDVISEMYESVTGEPLNFQTTRVYLSEWVESKKNETSARTYLKYFQVIHEFLAHIGTKADRLLRELTSKEIRSWRDALKEKGFSAPTVNAAISILRMPFKVAHDLGYIDINPCAQGAVKLLADETAHVSKEIFTPEQIRALLDTAKGEWQGMILCGYTTGLRLQDCATMRWDAINFGDDTITVTPQKTRRTKKKNKTIRLPLHRLFAEWLLKQIHGIGKAPVFPSLVSQPDQLSTQFSRIMDRAGIRGRNMREATGKGRAQSSLSFHSLRHTFNAALANAGVDLALRQELVGHSSFEMNNLYAHPSMEAKRRAVALLPAIPKCDAPKSR